MKGKDLLWLAVFDVPGEDLGRLMALGGNGKQCDKACSPARISSLLLLDLESTIPLSPSPTLSENLQERRFLYSWQLWQLLS